MVRNIIIQNQKQRKNAIDYIKELSKARGVYDIINDNEAELIEIDGNRLTFVIVDLYKSFQINGTKCYNPEQISNTESEPIYPETNQEIVVNFNTFISSMEKGNKYNKYSF